jgi:hypothetical protein
MSWAAMKSASPARRVPGILTAVTDETWPTRSFGIMPSFAIPAASPLANPPLDGRSHPPANHTTVAQTTTITPQNP